MYGGLLPLLPLLGSFYFLLRYLLDSFVFLWLASRQFDSQGQLLSCCLSWLAHGSIVWLVLLASNFIRKGFFVSSTMVYALAAACLLLANGLRRSGVLQGPREEDRIHEFDQHEWQEFFQSALKEQFERILSTRKRSFLGRVS
jgi:hypothetical protein